MKKNYWILKTSAFGIVAAQKLNLNCPWAKKNGKAMPLYFTSLPVVVGVGQDGYMSLQFTIQRDSYVGNINMMGLEKDVLLSTYGIRLYHNLIE